MVTEEELLELMRQAPDDDAPLLVYADWLLSRGDPRGELLALDVRDRSTPGGLVHRREVERLLVLAAAHGFPRLPDDPDADLLPFEGGGSHPVQYELRHGGRAYYLRYRHGAFTIETDDDPEAEVELDLDVESDGDWTEAETNVILSIVSRALRDGSRLADVVFPRRDAMRADPRYRAGLLPRYALPRGFHRSSTLAARDRDRWYALWGRVASTRT